MRKLSILLILSLSLFLIGCTVSTANISNVKMCEKVTDGECVEDQTIFKTDTDELHVSVLLENAPENTGVKFVWRYIDEDYEIKPLTLKSTESTQPVHSWLEKPDTGWPKGSYEVVITLVNTEDTEPISNSDPIHKEFKVE